MQIDYTEEKKMDDEEICNALNDAMKLEIEGYEFYLACADHTTNLAGRDMFKYLAAEEQVHLDKLREFRREMKCEYREMEWEKTNVFEENVPGGNLDNTSDAVDALNIGIKAEDNSIALYKKLADEAPNMETRKFFRELVEEERKHRMILENEMESITKTGAFFDFREVTS